MSKLADDLGKIVAKLHKAKAGAPQEKLIDAMGKLLVKAIQEGAPREEINEAMIKYTEAQLEWRARFREETPDLLRCARATDISSWSDEEKRNFALAIQQNEKILKIDATVTEALQELIRMLRNPTTADVIPFSKTKGGEQ